jgi:hypothetical protein
MAEVREGLVVYGQNDITHAQSAAAVCGLARIEFLDCNLVA